MTGDCLCVWPDNHCMQSCVCVCECVWWCECAMVCMCVWCCVHCKGEFVTLLSYAYIDVLNFQIGSDS